MYQNLVSEHFLLTDKFKNSKYKIEVYSELSRMEFPCTPYSKCIRYQYQSIRQMDGFIQQVHRCPISAVAWHPFCLMELLLCVA